VSSEPSPNSSSHANSRAPVEKNAVEFLGVPDKDWAIAKRRLEMIRQLVLVKDRTSRDVEKRAKKCKVSRATFYRWLIAYEETLRLSSLLPKQRSESLGILLLLPAVEDIIREAMECQVQEKGPASLFRRL